MTRRYAISAGRGLFFSAVFVIAGVLQAQAQDFFAAPRDFIVDRACNATRAIRSQADPVPLDVGKTYPARGVNRSGNPTHAFIRVGEANKWVELGCGHFADGASPAPGTVSDASSGGDRECLPFFDEVDNPESVGFGGKADITPKPPSLDSLDKAIMGVCGKPGKVVTEDEFKTMLRGQPGVIERIKAFTGGKVYADRPVPASNEDYLTDLTDAWFKIKAFDHIFCGEPEGRSIGGLHFRARYLQLQETGDACRMTNLRQNEVVPDVIYTMGVRMKNASGQIVQHSRKGYGLTMSGEDLLKIVTRAFEENPTTSTQSTGCLLPVVDDGKQFTTVFVRRAVGIRTFFPDATPNGKGEQQNPACTAAIDTKN
jgi:Bacterial EndoU nuclease